MKNNNKKIILSGITTSGDITLGNYIGVINNILKLQKNKNNKLIIFIANLHAITNYIEPIKLKKNIKNMIALYYACGLNPKKTIIFLQSDILENTQLYHILLCNTNIGELSRMNQFKEKKLKIKNENKTEFITTGLWTYPVLMAADILLFQPNYIPVGIDQKQHIELTKKIAKRINKKYNYNLFKIPKILISKYGNKIMDLQNPNKKMSKSSNNKNSYIKILDSPKNIKNKIKKSITDNEGKIYYDKNKKPGISNLLEIDSILNETNINNTIEKYKNLNYLEFKEKVSNTIINKFEPIQKKYKKIINKPNKIKKIINIGKKKAKYIAKKNLKKIKKYLGIDWK